MSAARPAPRGTGSGRVGEHVRSWATVLLLTLMVATLAGALLPPAPARAAPPAPAPPAEGTEDPADGRGAETVALRVDTLAPRVVTADGPPELLLTGTVTNRGTTGVSELDLRVQRGTALTGDDDTVTALGGDETDDQVRPEFTRVAGALAPGAEAPFALRVPLQGGGPTGLGLREPGVYPLLLNLNGRGDGGSASRLAAVRMLLPVLDLPGATPTPPRGDRATGLTVLYPVADRPRRLPTLPGESALLTDDELADSVAPGGRLTGLIDALARAAPIGSPAAGAVCLAVDADLLETVATMSEGYRVRGPDGPVPGRGAEAAGRWLDALRAQAAGRCVLALPFADTDLVATSGGGLSDLTTEARTTGAARVADILGTAPLPDTTMPADGQVDERTVADLLAGGAQGLLVDGGLVDGGRADGGRADGGTVRLSGPQGGSATAVALDPVAADALAPRPPSAAGAVSPAGTAAPMAAQDALGALVLRARASVPADEAPPTSVVAPPRAWAATPAEAAAYLDTVDLLASRGLVRPLDLAQLTAPPVPPPPASLTPPTEGDGTGETIGGISAGLAPPLVDRARAVRDRQRDLLAASEQDRAGAPTPSDLLDPLTEGLMRSLSATRRGDLPAQEAAIGDVEGQMDALAAMVRVVQPTGAYSLGSDDAPLLLTVENRLPVAVRVQMVIDPTPGLSTPPLPPVTIPSDGRRQFPVEVDLARSGQFVVDARAETPSGEPLGPPARLLLRSSAYGTITVWLTVSAAVVLVVLASIRIARRVMTARRQRRSSRGRRRTRPTRRHDPVDPPTRELQSR